MQLEIALLSEAARWNVREPIWQEITSRAQASDLNEQEAWLETAVPWILVEQMQAAGASEQAQTVASALEGVQSAAGREELVRRQTGALISAGRPQQAAALIERADWPETERNRWAMRLVCRLVRANQLDAAMQFVSMFQRDPLFREDALDMLAAQAAVAGHGPQMWDLVRNATGLRPTEKIACLRGFVVGVEDAPNAEPAGGASQQSNAQEVVQPPQP
jgi:hypothetical protein